MEIPELTMVRRMLKEYELDPVLALDFCELSSSLSLRAEGSRAAVLLKSLGDNPGSFCCVHREPSSHPPVKPARLNPATTYGERRMSFQIRPDR